MRMPGAPTQRPNIRASAMRANPTGGISGTQARRIAGRPPPAPAAEIDSFPSAARLRGCKAKGREGLDEQRQQRQQSGGQRREIINFSQVFRSRPRRCAANRWGGIGAGRCCPVGAGGWNPVGAAGSPETTAGGWRQRCGHPLRNALRTPHSVAAALHALRVLVAANPLIVSGH